ncbi:MAG TPA: hypothetical protein VHJ99_16210, partial [Candidatus Dormibacteraeota bacterium]|nr:hypothetical protein [Candidatus Dormibacteraeota bacterium]
MDLSQLVDQVTHWGGWTWGGWAWPGWVALAAIATVAAVIVALLAGFGWFSPRARLEVFVDSGPPGKIRIKSVSGPA